MGSKVHLLCCGSNVCWWHLISWIGTWYNWLTYTSLSYIGFYVSTELEKFGSFKCIKGQSLTPRHFSSVSCCVSCSFLIHNSRFVNHIIEAFPDGSNVIEEYTNMCIMKSSPKGFIFSWRTRKVIVTVIVGLLKLQKLVTKSFIFRLGLFV